MRRLLRMSGGAVPAYCHRRRTGVLPPPPYRRTATAANACLNTIFRRNPAALKENERRAPCRPACSLPQTPTPGPARAGRALRRTILFPNSAEALKNSGEGRGAIKPRQPSNRVARRAGSRR